MLGEKRRWQFWGDPSSSSPPDLAKTWGGEDAEHVLVAAHTCTRMALHHPVFSCSLSKELRVSCGPTYLHKQQIGLQFGHVCHPLLSSCYLTSAFGWSLASLGLGDSCYHISCLCSSAWCQSRAGVFSVCHKSPNQELLETLWLFYRVLETVAFCVEPPRHLSSWRSLLQPAVPSGPRCQVTTSCCSAGGSKRIL